MGSEVLEAATNESLAVVPVAFGRYEGVSLRGKNLDDDLRRDFTFARCSPARLDAVSSNTPLTCVWFRLSMMSDEVRELLLPFSCLETSRRLLDADEEPPSEWNLEPLPAADIELCGFQPLEELLRELDPVVRSRAVKEVEKFQTVQKHRLGLDLRRVTEYYSVLYEGLEDRRRCGAAPAELEAKKQALLNDFHRQVTDVRQKASIRVTVRPIAVLRMEMPVLALKLEMKVGTRKRELRLTWSPLRRKFEAFRCSRCGALGRRIDGTRDGDLVCPACAAGS